jgi:hypothetical protein
MLQTNDVWAVVTITRGQKLFASQIKKNNLQHGLTMKTDVWLKWVKHGMLNLNKWHCIVSPDEDMVVITPESLEYGNTSDKQKSSDPRSPGAIGALTTQKGGEQQSVRFMALKTRESKT